MKQLNLKKIEQMLKVIDPSEKRKIQKNIIESMSDFKIEKVLGDNNAVLMYSDLAKYQSIDQVLPTDKSFKIILIRETENSGHWVALLRYTLNNQTIVELFNSYGLFPSDDLKFMSNSQNIQLGQDSKHLNRLLETALKLGYNVIYNKYDFQKYSDSVHTYNTCGRWASIRVLLMLQYSFSLNDFIQYIKSLKAKYKIGFDEIVSLLI